MFVYAIGTKGGPHKIGMTKNVKGRFHSIQSLNPKKMFIAFSIEVQESGAVEDYAHWLLREKHISGEWFKIDSNEAKEAIENAIAAVKEGKKPELPNKPLGGRGRKRMWSENILARFARGTKAEIDSVRNPDNEDVTDFIRLAVDEEIIRRQRRRQRRAA